MPPKDTKKEAKPAAAAPAKKTEAKKETKKVAKPERHHNTSIAVGLKRGHRLSKRSVPLRNVRTKGVIFKSHENFHFTFSLIEFYATAIFSLFLVILCNKIIF